MKRIVDNKTGKKSVIFNTYNIGYERYCPECKRQMKSHDVEYFEENKRIRCSKCGAILLP